MCGIIGIVGSAEAAPLLVDGLRRLAYRGYDSAGIATLSGGAVERRRSEGKIEKLAALVEGDTPAGTTGIGHTRWATHGAPSTANAHPHTDGRVVVVHNGIIENHQELREELSGAGLDSAVIWVLAANPSRYFYEAMGGRREGERVERLWGADLKETGYGWPDLTKAIEALG